MDINLEKDPTIPAALARLERDLGAAAFVVVDDWDADLFAVGIASSVNPRVVAYLSTWQQPADRYYLELELPGPSDAELTTVLLAGGNQLNTLNSENELVSTLRRLRFANKRLDSRPAS